MLLSLSFVLAGIGHAEPTAKSVMRDVATDEQLAKVRKHVALNAPMKDLAVLEGEDPTKLYQPEDLLAQSDIICFNGLVTLVPKLAIISAPENFKERYALRPGAQFVGWADFYARNRGWITTIEVSRAQAEGSVPLKETDAEAIAKSKNLVVATFHNGPISLNPLRKPEPAEEEAVETP